MSLNRAIDKLIDTSRLIELRMAFKAAEGKRVREAFEVLTSGAPQPGSKGFKQKTVYLEVLQRVLTLLGPAEVALCAAALGPSSIAALKDRDRVALPHEMKKRKARFRGQHIQRLASQQSTGSTRYIHKQWMLLNQIVFTPTEAPAPEISKSPREELNQNTVVIAQTTDSSIPRSSLRGPTVGLPTSQTDQNVTCRSMADGLPDCANERF